MIILYVLKSLATGQRYIGVTNNLERRLVEHRRGNSKAGQQLGEFTLLHSEEFEDYHLARQREKYLKSGHGRAWLDRLEKRVGPAAGRKAADGG